MTRMQRILRDHRNMVARSKPALLGKRARIERLSLLRLQRGATETFWTVMPNMGGPLFMGGRHVKVRKYWNGYAVAFTVLEVEK